MGSDRASASSDGIARTRAAPMATTYCGRLRRLCSAAAIRSCARIDIHSCDTRTDRSPRVRFVSVYIDITRGQKVCRILFISMEHVVNRGVFVTDLLRGTTVTHGAADANEKAQLERATPRRCQGTSTGPITRKV